MRKLIFWWGLVFVLIIVFGTVRYNARNEYAMGRENTLVVENIKAVIEGHPYELRNEVRDPGRNNLLIGYRFQSADCLQDMFAIAFSVKFVARAFVEDWATEGQLYRFQYLDHSYQSSSRARILWLWVVSLVKGGLNLGEYRHSHHQIAVVWPAACNEPQANWSSVWRLQSIHKGANKP